MAHKKETFIDRRNRLLKSKGGQIKPNGKAGQAISGGADRGALVGIVPAKKKKRK